MNNRCRILLPALMAVLLSACANRSPTASDAAPAAHAPQPLNWAQVQARPLPPPGERLQYGPAPQQFGELRLPDGAGPHPVVVLIHGGCWLSQFDLTYFSHLADALTRQGFATWSIEYRRIGDDNGGWPGTFVDIGLAIDHLRELAAVRPLNLAHVATLGHSAGGQLALWAATRDDAHALLPADHPLPIRAVIGLAPITDMERYRTGPDGSCHSAVDAVMGGTPDTAGERYAAVSPAARLPLHVPVLLVSGAKDPIVSPASVEAFAQAALLEGDQIHLRVVAGEGHFDPAMPDTRSWDDVVGFLHATIGEPDGG